MTPRKRSGLSGEERELWATFTRSVAPLRQRRVAAGASEPAAPAVRVRKPQATAAAVASADAPKPAPRPKPLEPLDRRLKQRVARGTQAIEARLDLHGKSQSEAHAALTRFVRRAQRDGARLVLVITGKGGARGEDGRPGGVLKRQVPLWLQLPDLRPYIVAFGTAAVSHGGEGALYVRIRKSVAGGQ